MAEDTKHEWRQLSAHATEVHTVTVKAPEDEPLAERLAHAEMLLGAHDIVLHDVHDILDTLHISLELSKEHGHPEVERKIADVHETMTAVLKKSLTDQKCTQSLAHDNLKVAFGELAKRLEVQKKEHGDLAEDVGEHGDEVDLLHKCFDALSVDLTAVEEKLEALPTATSTVVVQKTRNWPAYIALLVALIALALHFVK